MSTIDLTMNVEGRDLGHVADDIIGVLDGFGQPTARQSGGPTIRRPRTSASRSPARR
jgi:hypothetical protein